jgi:hypothetical protein
MYTLKKKTFTHGVFTKDYSKSTLFMDLLHAILAKRTKKKKEKGREGGEVKIKRKSFNSCTHLTQLSG